MSDCQDMTTPEARESYYRRCWETATAEVQRLRAALRSAREEGRRERDEWVEREAENLIENVVNLHGYYEGNPHLASTSVRQGLAACAEVARELRKALDAPPQREDGEAPTPPEKETADE
jgi:hypothetical protein